MTIDEVVKVFTDKVPYRRPMKYARVGDTWYLYAENMLNGGKHLNVIENGYYSVEGNKVLPAYPVDMPRGINFISVPVKLRSPSMPEP